MIVRCKVCDTGTLTQRKKYRMSGPVVAIGYIFLIPSILGILFSVFMWYTAMSIPLSTNGAPASSLAGGVAIFFGIASFVGGLIGWLLVMKKKVLECDACNAVVSAS
jgi:hypothetical protein